MLSINLWYIAATNNKHSALIKKLLSKNEQLNLMNIIRHKKS